MSWLNASAAPMASGILAAFAAVLKPELARALVRLARAKPARCLGFGAVAVLLASTAAGVLGSAALGGTSNMLLAATAGTLFCLVLAASLAAGAVAMAAAGTLFKLDFAAQPQRCVAAGFAALTLVSLLPFLGWLVGLAAVSWGAGAVILHKRGESA